VIETQSETQPARSVAVIRPFRSHRTLEMRPGTWLSTIVVFLISVVGTYVLLRFAWPPLMEQANRLASLGSGMHAPQVDTYVGITYTVLAPGAAYVSAQAALLIAVGSAILLALLSVLPNERNPLRYWVSANLLVLFGSALFIYFTGRVGYDSETFMLLVERTSILVILCAPAFLSIISVLLPFSFSERLGMVAIVVVVDTLFAVVRVAAFALLASAFDGLLQANLYLFFGPLMDVIYAISVYSIAVVMLGRRIAKSSEAWLWL
jgi:hypothetical protein